MRSQHQRGFTIIEMLVVVTVIATILGIAIPNYQQQVNRADAARIASDVRTINLAVKEFAAENGSLPGGAAAGVVPPELSEYLETMSFTYKDVTYRVITAANAGTVRVRVQYPRRSLTGAALQSYSDGSTVVWTSRRTDFYVIQ